jgi:phage-related protein
MTTLNYSLIGANGDSITFDYENYVLNEGMRGHGIPATQVRIDESAGPGGIWRFSKRGVREIDMSVTILGVDRAEVEYRLRRLARLIQDTSGPTKLKADYSDGRSLSLDVHYTTGAESTWGADEGLVWCKWVLSFKAPQPYWESTTTQTFSITSGNTGRGLLPQLSKLKVSSSQSLGTVNVSNSADVPCFPTWTITGPITDLEITNGTQGFSFTEPVLAGQTIIVDTNLGTVTDSNGANLYYILGPAPKLFPFPPGNTTIEVLGISTTTATAISCEYALQYEVVH